MASKSLIVLVVCVLVASQANAQLSLLTNIIGISGQIFCSLDGNIVANATTPTPAFSNALVQVSCGGNVIASALTNGSGAFNIVLSPLQFVLSSILSSCNLVVATPLSSCNVALPATGILQSPLKFLTIVVRGLFSIVSLVPTAFQLISV